MKLTTLQNLNKLFVYSLFIALLSLVLTKPAQADMYKYITKEGKTLLTGMRLKGNGHKLIKIYRIKKAGAYKTSGSQKSKKSYSKKKRSKRKSSKKYNKHKIPKNMVKANGRDNGIIVGCHNNKHLSRQARIYQKTIQIYSRIYNVDAELVNAIVRQESCFNEGAHSRVGAIGLMQLMPQTALGLRITDPWNPEHNIQGGVKYIAQMLKRFNGNTKLAIAAYNAGPGNVSKYNGIPPFKETRHYVKRVYTEYKRLKTDGIGYPERRIAAK
jgi:soluble lytic murein transglycosylase-like protein